MKKVILSLSILAFLASCNSNTDRQSSKNEGVSDSQSTFNCSSKFQEDYSSLLSGEEMAAIYSFDLQNAKHNITSGAYGENIYSWTSDRPEITHEVSGMKIKAPDMNSMGIALVSYYDKDDLKKNKEYFDRGYKTLSDSELKEIDKNLESQDESVREAGKGLMETRKKSNWEAVDGVGNSAWFKWNDVYGGELAVLAGTMKFYIRLKVSEDSNENLEIAKKLAKKAISKCSA